MPSWKTTHAPSRGRFFCDGPNGTPTRIPGFDFVPALNRNAYRMGRGETARTRSRPATPSSSTDQFPRRRVVSNNSDGGCTTVLGKTGVDFFESRGNRYATPEIIAIRQANCDFSEFVEFVVRRRRRRRGVNRHGRKRAGDGEVDWHHDPAPTDDHSGRRGQRESSGRHGRNPRIT